MHRQRLLVALCVGLVAAGLGGLVLNRNAKRTSYCTARIDNEHYRLSVEQASNARTIAAVGVESRVPHHAVTVALATALQESQLRNLVGGDRDSVGLFQQRPSQGWGSYAQLHEPRYAAAGFYRALAHVSGWSTMSVTEAAQHVQRSAAPDAYARWEPEARTLARILTHEATGSIVCG